MLAVGFVAGDAAWGNSNNTVINDIAVDASGNLCAFCLKALLYILYRVNPTFNSY